LQFSAKVQNVCRGGINLVVDRQLETGRQLQICLPGDAIEPSAVVMAHIIRVAPHQSGEWAVGCNFASELTQEDLEAFGGKRVRPEKTDKRSWVRFPPDARARYQILREGESVFITCRAVDISAGGIALEVDADVDLGAILSVKLQSLTRDITLTLLACVVRVEKREGNRRLLGCNFIREMSDQELRTWLTASDRPVEEVRL
jgi:hypothetical protein